MISAFCASGSWTWRSPAGSGSGSSPLPPLRGLLQHGLFCRDGSESHVQPGLSRTSLHGNAVGLCWQHSGSPWRLQPYDEPDGPDWGFSWHGGHGQPSGKYDEASHDDRHQASPPAAAAETAGAAGNPITSGESLFVGHVGSSMLTHLLPPLCHDSSWTRRDKG